MTRGLHPPESLSADDITTLRDLRRDIYTNSAVGGFFGMGSGLIFHTAAQWARKLGFTKAKFNRNTMMLSVLGGGALGMFLFASSAGKERVHKLHPIYQAGAMPKQGGSDDHPKTVQLARLPPPPDRAAEEERNSIRAVRRKTVRDSIERGRGFSDAHGGRWYRDEDAVADVETLKEVRAARRRTLDNALRNQRGLSDSHGGRWS